MKQAIKKKSVSGGKFNLNDFKKNNGLGVSINNIDKSNADKPMEWIVLPKVYEEQTGLPGIPMGYMTIVRGWSDTGKSTLKNCVIASCQKQGILPVIFETENNFDWQHAIDCGMEATPIYGDVEEVDEYTGEIKTVNKIINYEGDFLYYDTDILAKQYGNYDYSASKETKTYRTTAVIEDVAACMKDLLDKQESGELPMPICFIWDSVGTLPSFRSYTSKVGNNMFDAGAMQSAFNIITNSRIPSSRKISSPYTNTLFFINKIWNDSMNSVGPAASIELKGGKSFFYALRLLIHVGGHNKASVKKLKCTVKGKEVSFGTQTKISIVKNHLPSPFTMTYSGEMVCVHNGIIGVDEVDNYKKNSLKEVLKRYKKEDGTQEFDISDNEIANLKIEEEEIDA